MLQEKWLEQLEVKMPGNLNLELAAPKRAKAPFATLNQTNIIKRVEMKR